MGEVRCDKEQVAEVISGTIGQMGDETIMAEARKIEISNCSRLGNFRLNNSRPISVTFQRKDDKEKILANKKYLPPGIYINEEYSQHIK